MNPSTAFGTVLVDELIRCGMSDVVLAPGSRSAPMALALAAAERGNRLRLHVRTDERSAGFLALGLAKTCGRPVAVVTTSGTAAVHLHAAVVEASYAGVPLIVLTADRPPELRGRGTNQTIDQVGLYGSAPRLAIDVPVPQRRAGAVAEWRALARTTVAAALGIADGRPGAVHLNLPLREPLLPGLGADEPWPESLAAQEPTASMRAPITESVAELNGPELVGPELNVPELVVPDRPGVATLLVLGDCPPMVGRQAVALAEQRCWPVIAEPTGHAGASATPGGLAALEVPELVEAWGLERVVVVGRPTLARAVTALLDDQRWAVERYAFGAHWPDVGVAADVDGGDPRLSGSTETRETLPRSRSRVRTLLETVAADGAVLVTALERVYEDAFVETASMSGLSVAADLVRLVPDGAQVFLGSSTPVRDVFRAARPRAGVRFLANRGAAGIDGSVSTAIGMALAEPGRPSYALLGDLTFLHDVAGLARPAVEPIPDLTIVVVDNGGGGIFAQLEPGRPEYAVDYGRVFGTPPNVDLAAVAAGFGWPTTTATSRAHLAEAIVSGGPRIVLVVTDQGADARLLTRVRERVAAVARELIAARSVAE